MAIKEKVLTAPMAIIKVDGIAVGVMKNISVNETINRGKVTSLGSLLPSELPALSWSGTLSCSFFMINLRKSSIPGLISRSAASVEDWTNSVLLQEDGVSVTLYKRKKTGEHNDPAYPNSKIKVIEGDLSDLEEIATINGLFLNRESFNISEGQVSGKDVEGDYMTPILFSLT